MKKQPLIKKRDRSEKRMLRSKYGTMDTTTTVQGANPRGRDWVFTWNNYPANYKLLFETTRDILSFYCMGEEICPTTGTPHLQGVFKTKDRMYKRSIYRRLPIGFMKLKRGTWTEAITYAKKDGVVHEWGEVPREQTERAREVQNDKYQTALELAKNDRVDEIDAEMQIRYYATLNKIAMDTKNLTLPNDLEWVRGVDCPNEWIYGPHNSGKSRTARAENPGFYTKMMNDLWEGYDGQEVVLLEDFDPFHKKLGYDLKIWADRYAFRGRKLYGSLVLRPAKIVITSQYHPRDIWDDQRTVDAICDRFKLRQMRIDAFEILLNRANDSIPELCGVCGLDAIQICMC